MILHFLEVWFVFAIVFAIGCWLGVLLYGGLSESRFAAAQGAVADFVGDGIDEIKWRLGVGPDWRPAFRASGDQNGDTPLASNADVGDLRPLPQPSPQQDAPEEPWPDEETWAAESVSEAAPDDVDDQSEIETAADELSTNGGEESVMRPAVLAAPRAGVPDNLRRIRGIGKRNEALLHGLGIYHIGQIAAWTPAEARWIASHLAFPDSIERDDWIGQAIVLASGGETGYLDASERRKRSSDVDG